MRPTLASVLSDALPDSLFDRRLPILSVSGHQPTWAEAIRELRADRPSPVDRLLLRWATLEGTFTSSGKRPWTPLDIAVPGDLRRFRRMLGAGWHGQAPLARWFNVIDHTEGDLVIGRADAGWTFAGEHYESRGAAVSALLASVNLDPLIDALLAASDELDDPVRAAAAADLFAGNGCSEDISRETCAQVRRFVDALTADSSVVPALGDHAAALPRR